MDSDGIRVMEKTIAVIGTVFMDIKGFAFNAYDPVGTNIGDIKFIHGGVGRNAAVNLANIGLPVSFVSTVDTGSTGDEIIAELEECNISTDYVLRTEKDGIGMWLAILNNSGDLVGSISKQPDFEAFKSYVNSVIDDIIENSLCVVLEIDITEEIAETVIDKAEAAGVPVYVLVGNMSVAVKRKDLLSKTDCFICNNIEAGKLSETELNDASSETILEQIKAIAASCGIKAMVITNGAAGSVCYDSTAGACGIIPAVETVVADTTGAGDAFFSGTVGALTKSKSLETACIYGARLASKVIASPNSSVEKYPDFFEK